MCFGWMVINICFQTFDKGEMCKISYGDIQAKNEQSLESETDKF